MMKIDFKKCLRKKPKVVEYTPPPRELVKKFVVRLYDGFDNEWVDITRPTTYEEALRVYNLKTENDTTKNNFHDFINYYGIFDVFV
jgi:hypothetical protein